MPDHDSDDAALVRATMGGNTEAFAFLVRRYIRPATLLASQLLGDQDEGEDIVQVAFTLVYRKLHTFDPGRPFAPWLYAFVRRLSANKRARDARRARLMRLWGALAAGRTAPVEPAELLDDPLATLSPMQRACFELVALRGLPVAEAAAMHGIAESTVRQHIFRARRHLTDALANDP